MMIFDRNEKKQVVALLGAGSMGTAIVRRIGAGKKILLGDISEKALERVGEDFRHCGYDVETIQVNALHVLTARSMMSASIIAGASLPYMRR